MVAIAATLIVLGGIGLLIPFVGPLFGFGMGPDPAFVWTTSRFVRHVIPGAMVIAGGLMLLPRIRASRAWGAALALVGGAWFTLVPIALGRGGDPAPAFIDFLRPTVYHFGLGVAIAAMAGVGFGRLSAKGAETAEAPEHATVREPSAREAPAHG